MREKRYLFPILMGFIMTVLMSFVNSGTIVFPDILWMILIQAIVALIASLIFPAGMIGVRLSKKYFPQLGRIGTLLVSTILPAVFFTAVNSISGLLLMRGYPRDFWSVYFITLPLYTLYGYIVSLVVDVLLDWILKTHEA